LITPASVICSRNNQIVFASGTRSPRPRSRKRINDIRSRIWNSIRSSERFYNDWMMRILNINTTS
jgi:hypothetical protein